MSTVKTIVLSVTLVFAGCANPADDKYQATASAPKPETDAGATATPATTASSSPALAPKEGATPAETLALPTPAANALMFSGATSKVDFVGSKVTGKHEGGFKTFKGFLEPTADGKGLSKVAVELDMDSLFSDSEKLTGHLKTADFFDVPKFAKALFVSTDVKPAVDAEKAKYKDATHSMTGNLNLHGVSKSITFPVKVDVKDGSATLASEFALNRKDFGVSSPGMANDLIRDEVVIKLDIKAPDKK